MDQCVTVYLQPRRALHAHILVNPSMQRPYVRAYTSGACINAYMDAWKPADRSRRRRRSLSLVRARVSPSVLGDYGRERRVHAWELDGPRLDWTGRGAAFVCVGTAARPFNSWTSVSNQSLVRRRLNLVMADRASNGETGMDTDSTALDWTGLEWPFPKGCSHTSHMAHPSLLPHRARCIVPC